MGEASPGVITQERCPTLLLFFVLFFIFICPHHALPSLCSLYFMLLLLTLMSCFLSVCFPHPIFHIPSSPFVVLCLPQDIVSLELPLLPDLPNARVLVYVERNQRVENRSSCLAVKCGGYNDWSREALYNWPDCRQGKAGMSPKGARGRVCGVCVWHIQPSFVQSRVVLGCCSWRSRSLNTSAYILRYPQVKLYKNENLCRMMNGTSTIKGIKGK